MMNEKDQPPDLTPTPSIVAGLQTVGDLEEAFYPGHAEASPAPPSTWPDLLRLAADILQDAVPLLEGGKKANVFQLLLVFAKLQAAWQAAKALRKPAPPTP